MTLREKIKEQKFGYKDKNDNKLKTKDEDEETATPSATPTKQQPSCLTLISGDFPLRVGTDKILLPTTKIK